MQRDRAEQHVLVVRLGQREVQSSPRKAGLFLLSEASRAHQSRCTQ